ncbi:MAG: hypothetical protein MOGMAGMI_01534 [Candidatus Omnitrophica bacterium]|nr:hypothetical protein [Candidatus Omnitrophota bacterium]
MLSTDRITIALTAYNRDRYFAQALRCAVRQTVRCAVKVVDDASDHDRFERAVEALGDPRVSYHRNPRNLGIIPNWNRCIELCETPWLSILHDDDLLGKRFIAGVLPHLGPDIAAVAVECPWGEDADAVHLDIEPGRRVRSCNVWRFLTGNLSPFPGVVFNVELARRLGGFRPGEYPNADMRFWVRLMDAGKVLILDAPMAYYRISGEQDLSEQAGSVVDACHDLRLDLAGRYPWPFKAAARLVAESSALRMKKGYESLYGQPVRVRSFDPESLESRRKRWLDHPLGRTYLRLFHRLYAAGK